MHLSFPLHSQPGSLIGNFLIFTDLSEDLRERQPNNEEFGGQGRGGEGGVPWSPWQRLSHSIVQENCGEA